MDRLNRGHLRRHSGFAAGGILLVVVTGALGVLVLSTGSSAPVHGAAAYGANTVIPGKTAFSFTASNAVSGAISETQAVATARQYSQAIAGSSVLPAGVTESVYYGQYSDEAFSTRPVWLIVYTGAGVNVPVLEGDLPVDQQSAGSPSTVQRATGPVAHEEAIAIDAQSGRFLTEVMASDMPTLPGQCRSYQPGILILSECAMRSDRSRPDYSWYRPGAPHSRCDDLPPTNNNQSGGGAYCVACAFDEAFLAT